MSELRQTLSVGRGTALMLNIVLGAGLLTLPGLAVRLAGDGALAVWAACALAAVPLLAVFAILGRRYPNAGGLAAILQRAFGDTGYVAATFLFLGAVVLGLPAIAITGGYYAAAMFGGPEHAYALGFLLGAVLVNAISVEWAGRINAAIASLLVLVLVTIAALGLWVVGPDLAPIRLDAGALPPLPIFGAAFMMVFFAFTGWEVGANLSGEFKDPARDFPIAIALSFLIAVALYGVLALIVGSADLGGLYEAPFAALFEQRFGFPGVAAIGAISVLLIFANLSAAVWAVSRMVYSAATERVLPAELAVVRNGIPHRAVIFTVAALSATTIVGWTGLVRLDGLLAYAGQNFLLLYAGAAAALVRLSGRLWHRLLGLGSVLLVIGLVAARGLEATIYPAALIVLAVLIARQRRAGRAPRVHTEKKEARPC